MVAFLLWCGALEKALTMDYLRKRGIIIMDWCVMCKSRGESVANNFQHRVVAQELWPMVFCLIGVS